MGKITTSMIEQFEAERYIDFIMREITSDEFVGKHCGEELKDLLLSIPRSERSDLIETMLSHDYLEYGFKGATNTTSTLNDEIAVYVGEIEFQFEGDAEDVFDAEALEDLSFSGNLAYLAADYFSIRFNMERLESMIEDYFEGKFEDFQYENRILLVDERHGIYVPKVFAELWNDMSDDERAMWEINTDEIQYLSDPDADGYWDAWHVVLDSATYTNELGHAYYLDQDGDLYLVPKGFFTK
jgi:hypothetical protein